jgi:hypothetical protein
MGSILTYNKDIKRKKKEIALKFLSIFVASFEGFFDRKD